MMIIHILYLPKSKKLSNRVFCLESKSMEPVTFPLIEGSPGWIVWASKTPSMAFINEVPMKYVNVRIAIFPFNFASKLAEPAFFITNPPQHITTSFHYNACSFLNKYLI